MWFSLILHIQMYRRISDTLRHTAIENVDLSAVGVSSHTY